SCSQSGWKPIAGQTVLPLPVAASSVRAFVSWSQPTPTTAQTSCSAARARAPRRSSKAGSWRWQWLSMITLCPRYGHSSDEHGGRGCPVAEDEVVTDPFNGLEHLEQVARDRDFLDRVRQLAVVDPEPDRAARIVARHAVDPEADQLRDVEALLDAPDQRFRVR